MNVKRGHAALALAVAAAGYALFTPALRTAGASEPDPADQLLAQSRDAATAHDFFGVVRVRWTDDAGTHARDVVVRSEDGVVALGDRRQIVTTGARRFVLSDGGWSLLWSEQTGREPPRASDKWDLRVSDGPKIAGRTTRMVEAADRNSGTVRERRFLDEETDLLLAREVFDTNGRTTRAVKFTRIGAIPATGPESSPPRAPHHGKARQPDVLREMPEPFRAPSEAGRGFRLLGRYRQPDGIVQLYYSDGLFGASVFEQEGRLDWDELPPGGTTADVAGRRTRQYRVEAGSVLVWQSKGIVYTAISDAPPDLLDGMVTDFPARASRGVLERVGDFLFGPFNW